MRSRRAGYAWAIIYRVLARLRSLQNSTVMGRRGSRNSAGRKAQSIIQNTYYARGIDIAEEANICFFWRYPMDNATIYTGDRGGFYRWLSERHRRINGQLGLLDRPILWFQG